MCNILKTFLVIIIMFKTILWHSGTLAVGSECDAHKYVLHKSNIKCNMGKKHVTHSMRVS